MKNDASQADKIARFRALHASGCFVMPNPWDVGSAVYLHRLGFQALATTSAGMAFARGLPDLVSAVPRDAVLEHVRDIVGATPLPVNADYQSGYGRDADEVGRNVALCVATGVAGLSIEDATGDSSSPLYEKPVAIARLRAARRAIDASGVPVVLTARCEAWLVGHPRPHAEALDRLAEFAAAGADCLFAPGVREPDQIAALVEAVAPKPLNVLVSSPSPSLSLARLTDLGVRRISVGSALARVAWAAFVRAADGIAETGSFDALAGAMPHDEINALFDGRRG